MVEQVLTDDFETGFIGGHVWSGIDGLRDFLSQREASSTRHTTTSCSTAAADEDVQARRGSTPASTPGGSGRWTARLLP